jgi:DNA-binding transcriptional MerR regulator
MAKSSTAFRTISEVAEILDLTQHVLRFWETKFKVIKPIKRGGGRRYYRPKDIDILRRIRDLLYDDGYTIKGVQKLFNDSDKGRIKEAKQTVSENISFKGENIQNELKSILSELEDIRSLIKA